MPFKEGKTLVGFGVLRSAPWHFAGLFGRKLEADAKAAELGEGYEVHHGEHLEGTDNFVLSNSGAPNT